MAPNHAADPLHLGSALATRNTLRPPWLVSPQTPSHNVARRPWLGALMGLRTRPWIPLLQTGRGGLGDMQQEGDGMVGGPVH